ncbi:hypothetical protein MGH68_05205 [Erysipelothrix sp. D19-032]
MNTIIEDLVTLLNIKSPTGHTEAAIQFVASKFETMGLKTRLTNKGALIATLPELMMMRISRYPLTLTHWVHK